MQMFLSHETALQIWRSNNLPPLRMSERFDIPTNFVPSVSAEEACRFREAYNIAGTLTGSVRSTANNRRRNGHLHSRMHPACFPNKEYIRLEANVYVASPELTLAQIASRLASMDFGGCQWKSALTARSAAQIILTILMCEMCGNYVFVEHSADGFRDRPPITSVDKLRRFASQTGQFRGRKIFDAAINSVLPNSYSPAETNLSLLETLAVSLGGLGLAKKPQLNLEVKTRSAYEIKQRRGDQVFADEKIVIEYNGGYHEGERANKDDARRIELENAGFHVITINKEELFSASRLEWALTQAIRKIGKTGRRAKDYESRRDDLRAILFELSNTSCWENQHRYIPNEYLPPSARGNSNSLA